MGVVKLTPVKKKAYIELLKQGWLKGKAAEELNLNRHTIGEAAKVDSEFAQAIGDAFLVKHENVEDALYKRAMQGNVTAMIFYLSNRMPDRWQDVKNIAIKGQLLQMTPEDIDKRLGQYTEVFKELAEKPRGAVAEPKALTDGT